MYLEGGTLRVVTLGRGYSWFDTGTMDSLFSYILIVEEGIGRVEWAKAELRKLASLPRWKPCVDAISLIKGVDWFGALLVTVEIGDFDRFKGCLDVSK